MSTTAKRLQASQNAHRGSVLPMLRIDDALTAAAALILSIICEGKEVPPRVETRLRDVLGEIAGPGEVNAAVATAMKLQRKTPRIVDVVQVLGELLRDRLPVVERLRLVEMLQNVFAVSPYRFAHTSNHIVALRDVLGMTDTAS